MKATKVFSVEQTRQADRFTIEHEPVDSLALMERAAVACAGWIKNRPYKPFAFYVFCGTGNNGGDGLAIARLLLNDGYSVCTYVIQSSGKCSKDFLTNEEALKKRPQYEITYIESEEHIPLVPENSVIIDALFGTGLSKPIEGLTARVIESINACKAVILSVDLASGLFADQHSNPESAIVRPDFTLCFQFPKPSFFFPDNELFVGACIVLDIGLHPQFLESEPARYYYLTEETVKCTLKHRRKFSHKGNFGHSLILAGSEGKIGAAILAARACLRTGTGLLTMQVPGCGFLPVQTAVPESMVMADQNTQFISEIIPTDNYRAIGIGPGIGTGEGTVLVFESLLKNSVRPMVLDADALNILSSRPDLLGSIPKHSILTPHLKEFERLAGIAENDFHRNLLQVEFSQLHQVYVVLKGAHTCISTPDGHCYFNSTGNPGMAKGGSGDVLTGIITGLLAQSYHPLEAANVGVFIHGLAADFATSVKGQQSLIASDIIDHLPDAFMRLCRP
jgi:NAD(P)H-hydrate epimerase